MIRCLVLLTFANILACSFGQKQGCTLHVPPSEYSPLILAQDSDTIVYPEHGQTDIKLADGASVRLTCPESKLEFISKETAAVTCSNGAIKFNDKELLRSKMVCATELRHAVMYPSSNGCVAPGSVGVDIGYKINQQNFIHQISICFDQTNEQALYSFYDLTKSVAARSYSLKENFFIKDSSFFTLKRDIFRMYSRFGQKKTINSLLGLPANSDKYVKEDDSSFLEREKLAPEEDFIYPPQQRATHHYINAAPMWKSIEQNNWGDIEKGARHLASHRELDLMVYTGTYGIATLPHEASGLQTELYLYISGKTKKTPVPEFFWKVLYEPQNKRGIAFVTQNNPYLTYSDRKFICKDISAKVKYLDWKPTVAKFGFSYACDVGDLRKIVTTIPNLSIKKLLV